MSGASNAPAVTYDNLITSTDPCFLLNQAPNAFGIQPNTRTPYTIQYLFNVQREVGKNNGVAVVQPGGVLVAHSR